MEYKAWVALIKKHKGWVERVGRDEFVARFPSVWNREQFEREVNA